MRFDRETLVENIRRLATVRDRRSIRRALATAQPIDIAEAIQRSKNPEAARILQALEPAKASEVLVELPPQTARALVVAMPAEVIAAYLDVLEMDDATALIDDLPLEDRETLLQAIPPQDAAEIRRLLGYPPDTAGRVMTENFPWVMPDWTAAQTLQFLRDQKGKFEQTYYLYVTEEAGALLGVCTLRQVVEADQDDHIGELMTRDLVTVAPETDQEEVAQLIARYDFLSLPVVDRDDRLLGIVMVDDVIDILKEEETEDVYKQAAVTGGPEPYLSLGIWQLARRRFGWLVLLEVASFLTALVLQAYQREVGEMVALSFFIPMLIGTGGNAGSQAATMATRAIALGELKFRDFWQVLGRELVTGLMVGVLLGGVGFLRANTMHVPATLPLVVMMSQVSIVVWATTVGALLPLFAHRVGFDPALMSSPALATLVDATGLLIYFQIARYALGL